jgi:hypothetical protein
MITAIFKSSVAIATLALAGMLFPLSVQAAFPPFEVDASCYAWQVHDETISQVIYNVSHMAGVNALYLVALMHQEHRPFSASRFPLDPVRVGWDAQDARIYWIPETALYGTIKPLQSDTSWLKAKDWLTLVCDSAHAHGMMAGGEVSHTPIPGSILNSNTAYQQKDINGALKGGICVNNPDVHEYLLALFGDMAKNHNVDWIQTCMYLYSSGTCYCSSCQTAAKAAGFDLTAAIPILKANANAQPQLNNFITFRRNSTTKIYKDIADRIHQYKPNCEFRLNDVHPWDGISDSSTGLFLQDCRAIFNSCVIQSHTEQNGSSDFSQRISWLNLNRKLLGPGVRLLSGVAVRLSATPALEIAGIKAAVGCNIEGIALKHYDGSNYSQLRAVRAGLSAAGVAGFTPVVGIEAESMTLSGYTSEKYNGENCIRTNGTGTATAKFTGSTGNYDLVISYEDDPGAATLTLSVGGVQKSVLTLNEDVSCWRTKAIPNVTINNGDEIKIVGVANGSDLARVDFIETTFKGSTGTNGANTPSLPLNFSMTTSGPGHASGGVRISYSMPGAARVKLTISNTGGKTVRTLENCQRAAGEYSVLWDGKNDRNIALPCGMYWGLMRSGSFSKVCKINLIK